MNNLRVLIVDDEPLAIRRLELLLRRIEGVEGVGSANGCDEALARFSGLGPDVVLLDIRMRDGTGFDFLGRLPADASPAVIFVTAFDDYAIRAFDAAVVDYVLKPVEASRLDAAFQRARKTLSANDAAAKLATLKETIDQLRDRIREQRDEDEDIWVGHGGSYVRVPIARIEFARSEGEYVRIHTADSSHLLRISIKQLEDKTRPGEFTRTHRSALVRTAAIESLRRGPLGSVEIILRGGQAVPAGRVYAKKLRATIIRRKQEDGPAAGPPE